MMDDGSPFPETSFFTDDATMIAEMLKESWSLPPNYTPVINQKRDGMMTDAREGYVDVYKVSNYTSTSSTDYRTLQRTSFLDITVTISSRHVLFLYMEEIYRILYGNRRVGPRKLNGYTWLEITNDRVDNESNGWYSGMISLKLMSYCYPIRSPGFGDRVNSMLLSRTQAQDY